MSALVDGTERCCTCNCPDDPGVEWGHLASCALRQPLPEPGSAASRCVKCGGTGQTLDECGSCSSTCAKCLGTGAEPGSAVAPRCPRCQLPIQDDGSCSEPCRNRIPRELPNLMAGAVASEAPRVDPEAGGRSPLTPIERREWESARQTWIEIADLRYQNGFEKGLQRAAELCERAAKAPTNMDAAHLLNEIRAELKGGGT